ncbi:hypothetical protein CCHOA_08160 [Corynebacterium choanae]|uniref:Uncharacterized protein n=1 Tax=Corynebacterium choanae TaxID=1862358 RepID=A0A3G6J8C3_9CORY|nr:hypothetical protein CCHOA_08160 [Corynebacterium choanae]
MVVFRGRVHVVIACRGETCGGLKERLDAQCSRQRLLRYGGNLLLFHPRAYP